MDEATSALDKVGGETIMKLLIEELPETSVVSIGHRPGLEVFHTRELTLVEGEARGWRRCRPSRARAPCAMSIAACPPPAAPSAVSQGFWATLATNVRSRRG